MSDKKEINIAKIVEEIDRRIATVEAKVDGAVERVFKMVHGELAGHSEGIANLQSKVDEKLEAFHAIAKNAAALKGELRKLKGE